LNHLHNENNQSITILLIKQDKRSNVPSSQIVRVFVKFSEMQFAAIALAELDNFGNRTISSSFYDQQLFAKNDFNWDG